MKENTSEILPFSNPCPLQDPENLIMASPTLSFPAMLCFYLALATLLPESRGLEIVRSSAELVPALPETFEEASERRTPNWRGNDDSTSRVTSTQCDYGIEPEAWDTNCFGLCYSNMFGRTYKSDCKYRTSFSAPVWETILEGSRSAFVSPESGGDPVDSCASYERIEDYGDQYNYFYLICTSCAEGFEGKRYQSYVMRWDMYDGQPYSEYYSYYPICTKITSSPTLAPYSFPLLMLTAQRKKATTKPSGITGRTGSTAYALRQWKMEKKL